MEKEPASKRLWRLSAMGFTFISMVIAGGIIGLGIHWGCGLVVDFIRDAMRAVKDDS